MSYSRAAIFEGIDRVETRGVKFNDIFRGSVSQYSNCPHCTKKVLRLTNCAFEVMISFIQSASLVDSINRLFNSDDNDDNGGTIKCTECDKTLKYKDLYSIFAPNITATHLFIHLNRQIFLPSGETAKFLEQSDVPLIMSQDVASGLFLSVITTDQVNDDNVVDNISISPNSGQLLYHLESIIIHSGNEKHGHYYCFTRSIKGVWRHENATARDELLNCKFGYFYKFNDTTISCLRITDLKDLRNQNVCYVYKICR